MPDSHIEQLATELILSPATVPAQIEQLAVEVMTGITVPAQIEQLAVEVMQPTAMVFTVSSPNCNTGTLQTVTLTGYGFPTSPTVQFYDPVGTPIASTVVSATSSEIVCTLYVATCGTWTVCVESVCVPFLTSQVAYIRRLRRFMLPWDEGNRQKFISRIEFILQAGIGNAQAPDPVIMLRFSGDGGLTWTSETQMGVGKLGEYQVRAYLYGRWRARNPVVEIAMSDPVDWQLLQCLADMEEGTS